MNALLAADEPPAVLAERRHGTSPFVITVDHASARIPRCLGDLGLPASELQRHIAWDIGSLGVARRVAEALDAPLVAQNYSRLVIDCNRQPGVATSIPTMAESLRVPGNIDLNEAHVAARRSEIFEPYHAYLSELLDERRANNERTILIGQHTMTDFLQGARRKMHASVLYYRDRGFSGIVLDVLRRDSELLIAENEPYVVDETHYTILQHAEARDLPYVEIEIRQDLVSDERGQSVWARRIGAALQAAEREFHRSAA